jgi:hypothetical protein
VGIVGKPVRVGAPPSAEVMVGLQRDSLELPHLIVLNCECSNGPEHPLRHRVTVEAWGKGEYLFPDLRREP